MQKDLNHYTTLSFLALYRAGNISTMEPGELVHNIRNKIDILSGLAQGLRDTTL